jgi:hypothetical protein
LSLMGVNAAESNLAPDLTITTRLTMTEISRLLVFQDRTC